MTTATSVEELDALDVGSTATLRARSNSNLTITRTNHGFTLRDAVVPTSYLAGAVAEGRVIITGAAKPGDFFQHGTYRTHMILTLPDGDTHGTALEMDRDYDRYGTITFTNIDQLGSPCSAPGRYAGMVNLVGMLGSGETAEAVDLDALRRQVRTEVLNEVRDHMVAQFDGNNFDEDEVSAIFEHFGLDPLGPDTEEVDVEVSVDGVYSLDYDEAERMIESDRAVDVASAVEIPFTWNTTISKSVDAGTCACEEVSLDDVSSAMENRGISYATFDYTVECSNC